MSHLTSQPFGLIAAQHNKTSLRKNEIVTSFTCIHVIFFDFLCLSLSLSPVVFRAAWLLSLFLDPISSSLLSHNSVPAYHDGLLQRGAIDGDLRPDVV